MRIAHLEPANVGQQGDHAYRTAQPCRALAAHDPSVRVLSGSWLSPAMRTAARAADLLMLCKVVEPDLLPILAAREGEGLPTVFEINDDFTDVQAHNSTARFYANPDTRSLVMQLARRASALQLSSEGLLAKFGHLNRRVQLMPNQLERVGSARTPPPDGAPTAVTVGWGGSFGHRDDLAACMEGLRAALDARPALTLAIMGDPRLSTLFAWVPRGRLRFVEAGPLEAYERFLESLDIGIAPLLPTDFNRGRSDVKYLEYAARGVAPVCADEVPYRTSVRAGETGLLFRTPGELAAAITRLVDEPCLAAELGERARQEVASTRRQAQHAGAHLSFYRELAGGVTSTRGHEYDRVFDAGTADASAGGYRTCVPTAAEAHLYNGLLSQTSPAQARRDLEAALGADKGNYLTHLHLARCEPAAADTHLRRAGELATGSCAVPHLAGCLALQRGRPDDARAHFERALAVAPVYAPARARLGLLAEQRGDLSAAAEHYERCLRDNPDHGVAALALAALRLRTGALPLARETLRRHADACHDDHRFWMLLGQSLLAERRAEQAVEALERAAGMAPEAAQASLRPWLAKAHALNGELDRARALISRT